MLNKTSLTHLPTWLRLGGLCMLLAAGFSLLLAPPPAQAWAGEMQTVRTFPELATQYWAAGVKDADWADWDNDGDLDLAVILYDGYSVSLSSMVFENQGGALNLAWQSVPAASNFSGDWGDYNNDSLPDLAIGGLSTSVYRNTGGDLEETWTAGGDWVGTQVAWADMNGDGYDDLAVGGQQHPLQIFASDGLTLTLAWTAPVTVTINALGWADVDGDNDPDLAVGSAEGLRIYYNVGGVLSDTWDAPNLANISTLAWADWDNNGYPDLALGVRISYGDGEVLLLTNQAGSLALAWSAQEVNAPYDLDWGDWDGDGDPDLAVGNGEANNDRMRIRIYENRPAGLALGWSSDPADIIYYGTAVAWGDFDRDGDADLFVGSYIAGDPSRLLGNQEGRFETGWTSPNNYDAYALAWADLDGDADLDLALGTADQGLQLWHSQDGVLSLAWTAADTEDVRALAWGDVDNDGDLDLAIGGSSYPVHLYTNTAGVLSLAWSAALSETTTALAWADLDRDGDLDLAAGGPGRPVRLYTNTGSALSLAWSAALSENTTSLAWADYDGDNDLDLAVGSDGSPVRIYRNTASALALAWSSTLSAQATSLAWADWDNDGDPDLAVGNYGQPLHIYRNDLGNFSLSWSSAASDHTTAVQWADWDGDGDLDLAVGNFGEPNKVYANLGSDLIPLWAAEANAGTRAIAWGDWDNDGDLDLAAANHAFQPLTVYANQSEFTIAWSFLEQMQATGLAWGDMDNDGDLDLAVSSGVYWEYGEGNTYALYSGYNRVYRRTSTGFELAWTSPVRDNSTGAAWADYDGDGDLDLSFSAATYWDENSVPQGGFARLYRNDGNTFTPVWTNPQANDYQALAWADVDQDGDLDLAVQGYWPGLPDLLFINQGGTLTQAWEYDRRSYDTGLAWGDYDNDGYPDLVSAAHLFPNQNGQLGAPVLVGGGSGPTWGDWDGDGDLDLGSGREGAIYANNDGDFLQTWQFPYLSPGWYHSFGGLGFADWNLDFNLDAGLLHFYENSPLEMCIYDSYSQVPQRIWCSPDYNQESVLAWGDYDGDGDPDLATGSQMEQSSYNNSNSHASGTVRVYANHANDAQAMLDSAPRVSVRTPGGGSAPALTGNFATAVILQGPEIEIEYTLRDLESDPVRFIRAWFSLDGGSTWQPAVAASGTITQNLAASPAGTTHTFTWDLFASGVSGSSDTTVFRVDAVQGFAGPGPYQYAYRWAASNPFRVRGSQVRVLYQGQPAASAWVFRQPASSSAAYQPYTDLTGARLATGLGGYLLGSSQINLGDHLAALAPITGTRSYTLYYGSAAPTLTGITPYTVTQHGVQILEVSADNPLLLFNLDVSLEWDARYDAQFLSRLEYDFQRTSELLFDWSNGQAALGQVRLYHDRQNWADAHIQIYASNRVRPNAAQGGITDITASDPLTTTVIYEPGQVRMGATWNRFGDPGGNLGEDWARALAHELGHYALYLDDNYLGFDDLGRLIPIDTCPGAMSDPYRDDYSEFHPLEGWLPGCAQTLSNQTTGRADWQTISAFYPWLEGETLNSGPSGLPLAVTDVNFIEPIAPNTSLPVPLFYLSQDGHRLQPGSSARAWLFSAGEETLTDLGRPNLDQVLARGASPSDRLCVFEPAQARLGCEVIQAGDEQLTLYSLGSSLPEINLAATSAQQITVTVDGLEAGLVVQARLYPADGSPVISLTLAADGAVYRGLFTPLEPAAEGAVQVWVEEPAPRREIVTDYALGGSPARLRGRMARLRGRMAPAVSSDGQVILFGENLTFPEGEFFSLQALTSLPQALPWATPVGQAYRLLASANAPALSGASISFSYLGSEVPPGEENWLKVYYYDEAGADGWQALPTTLDTANNHAVATAQGPGLYALLSSLEIPLYRTGWNLFAYPVQATRPITEALLSVSGYYTTVYGYEGADLFDPWKMYDVTAAGWANDLAALEFAHAYWIQTNQTITLFLRGVEATPDAPLNLFAPPSTFYGTVLPGAAFTPTAGLLVQASIEGLLCGQGLTLEAQGQIVYSINVFADGPGAEGCGEPGKIVSFQVAGQTMQPTASWTNEHVQMLDLAPGLHAPSAADDAFETLEDHSLILDVLSNDSGDQLALLGVGLAAHGLTLPIGNTILYTPTLNYFGGDSFTYTITNGSGLVDTATVTMEITPVNDPPEAVGQSLATPEDMPLNGVLSAVDVDGDPLVFTPVTAPKHGSLLLAASGAFTYTPSANYFGDDNFTFGASDGILTDTATVTLEITPVNDAPSITPLADQTVRIGYALEGLVLLLSDIDNLPADLVLSAASSNPGVIDPAGIQFSGSGLTRSLALHPQQAGASLITLTVSDGDLSSQISFTLTVNPARLFLPIIQRFVVTLAETGARQPGRR